MATHSLHPESVQGNENLLQDIAKVYVQLTELHNKGHHLWPEDENPLQLCIDHLQETASNMDMKTISDCMAVTVISAFDWESKLGSEAVVPQMEGKAIQAARQLILEH